MLAWAIDRLGRSLIDLLGTIQHLEACKVDLYLDQQSIDTTTPPEEWSRLWTFLHSDPYGVLASQALFQRSRVGRHRILQDLPGCHTASGRTRLNNRDADFLTRVIALPYRVKDQSRVLINRLG